MEKRVTKGKIFGIPCRIIANNQNDDFQIEGTNWFYDKLIMLRVYLLAKAGDCEIINVRAKD